MSRQGQGAWIAALAAALIGTACARGGAPESITTIRSAVTTNVVVTVRDAAGALLPNIEVYALNNAGSAQYSETTNASGQATLAIVAGSWRFSAMEAGSDFYSGAVGHCVTPGCTTASITVPLVDVTVVDTNGAPQVGELVFWENASTSGGWVETGANGHAIVAVPTGSYRFGASQNGWDFYSGSAGHCTVPSCTAVTITTTVPITVTVKNTNDVPQPNLLVGWEDTLGESGGWQDTNASGVATLSAPPGAYRFFVYTSNTDFTSGAPGHCVVPGCTSATITIGSPVVVTVVDTAGTPLSGKPVVWQNEATDVGGSANTNASGQATIIPPLVPVRFRTQVDGAKFYSSETFNCAQPGCSSATILVSEPTVVTVVDGSGAPVSGKAVTPTSDNEDITAGNKTTNASGLATFRLPFARWQFKAKCAANNEFFFSGNANHCFLPGGCLTAKIKMPCGQCTGKPNGFACDDQTACSGSSNCQSQKCTGASPMNCSASDQCHDVGACGAEAGACSNPPKTNGSSCNDNNACTGTSSCQAGVCTGGNEVACPMPDQCHLMGTCNPTTGLCSNPEKSNGSACSDGNSCTSPDTCQSGTCVAGANSCSAIAVTQTVGTTTTRPVLTATLLADRTLAAPGDSVGFTSTITNDKMTLLISNAAFNVANVTASPFVVGAYRHTIEYQDATNGVWTPFARRAYDAEGNVVPETPATELIQLEYGSLSASGGNATYPPPGTRVVGTSIPAGGNGNWAFDAHALLPPDVAEIVFDPAQSTGMRAVVSVDVPSAAPQLGIAALDPGSANLDVDNIVAQLSLRLHPSAGGSTAGGALTSSASGPLALGASREFTGTFVAPGVAPFPMSPSETESEYRHRLFTYMVDGYKSSVVVNADATPEDPIQVTTPRDFSSELPGFATAQKLGPSAINAGFTGQYSVTLPNTGNGVASQLTLTDSVDGSPVTIGNLSLPSTVAAATSGGATFTAAVPLARPAGPMTDVVALTWKDRNGNLYGPITASHTGTINAGHPEGYLTIAGITDVPHLLGPSPPLTVTALDPYGNPAPGVSVHFAVTGIHPQTADIATGADGKATFAYTGGSIGQDDVVATATITTTPVTTSTLHLQWASAIGTACTGRATPLDIMLVVDTSSSMVTDPGGNVSVGKLEAARDAAHRFIDGLTYSRDQVGIVAFRKNAVLDAQLGANPTAAKSALDAQVTAGIECATNICGTQGSNLEAALETALDELEGPRHHAGATRVLVYIGDGGLAESDDPTAQIARIHTSGVRGVALAIGSDLDGALIRQIASSANDYFYAPSAAGIDFAFNNLNQNVCRNLPPVVSAGGDQVAYNVRIPSMLALQGEVHDDGANGDLRLTSQWSLVSGPSTVAFQDPTSPVTNVLFDQPGTYVVQLEASDGYLTVADRATITVDPDPSLVGANLAVALSAPGPLETGQTETLTATLTDGLGAPIRNFAVHVTVAGANPLGFTLITDTNGIIAFTYQGDKPGTDVLHATAYGSSFQLDSSTVSVVWIQPATGGAALTQGWIGAPTDGTKLSQPVEVRLSNDVTLANGTVKYFPASTPSEVHILAANVSRQPNEVIATFDTTLVPNDTYVLQLDGTDTAGNSKSSVVLVYVTGDYKPGRVVFEVTDFTVPIAGLPITIGRRYDSLEKDKIGDFGHGWSLTIGHPRVEVAPNHAVSITLPNGRRTTFGLALNLPPLTAVAGPANPFKDVYFPGYEAEPGVFGTLTQTGGCPVVRYFPDDPANPVHCFFTFGLPPDYVPDGYIYTDPYGTAYSMAASGEMRWIKDRQGNTLTFQPNGIISNSGRSVSFERDPQGQGPIRKIWTPTGALYAYTYENGDLTRVDLPPSPDLAHVEYEYDQHRLKKTTDPLNHPSRTSVYEDGRLKSDTDAAGNITSYEYDLDNKTTVTKYPDYPNNGQRTEVFDAQGLLISETDPRGYTTTHEYENRLETRRVNALGEETTSIYEGGNQTSVTDPLGTTETTYNSMNLPTTFTDRLSNTTTIGYDDRGVPKSFSDSLGTRFAFTSSEQGLPLTVDDAAGKRAYLTYDAAGNVTSRTDWLGRVTRATYDQLGNKLTETTAKAGLTIYQYLPNGKAGFSRDPSGYERTFSYDKNGNLVEETDNVGRRKQYTYNALNHLVVVRDFPDGATAAVVSYERDFRGNPTKMTDENGHITRYEYDENGNLKKTIFDNGNANPNDDVFTLRTYDALNRLASVTDERGLAYTTNYAYHYSPASGANCNCLPSVQNCICRDSVTTVTDPLTHATITGIDSNGRTKFVTDANNHTTTYEYDARGHLTDTHYPDGTSTHDAYDPRGRRESTTDQMSQPTLYGYDDQGQLTSVTDPLTNVTQYGYDLDGNLTSITDANNHETRYEYDLLRRKTKRTLPMGQFETFTYDLGGRMTERGEFSPAGTNCGQQPSPCKKTSMTYDLRDRMLTKVPDSSRAGELPHVYTYWPNGLRKTATNASGTTTYGYDHRDRLTSKATPVGILKYTYDAAGNVATIRSWSDDVTPKANGTHVAYGWDRANQLTSITDYQLGPVGVGETTTATYTATNRPATLAQPNGIGLTYSYADPMDRVTSMVWQQGATAFASWAYGHNNRGQRTTSTDITTRSAAYGYDGAARLTSETITSDPRGASFNGALSYVLDGAGNRISRASTLAALGAQAFTYNANDEISGDTFDANGNTIASGGHTYAYDFENRLVSKDGGAVTIAYDCDGNRVAKTAGGVTTQYLVDDLNPTGYLQVIEEIIDGAVQTRYTYGTSVVSHTRDVSTTPATSYYGFDAHGNVTFLTDAVGAVTDSYDYDAWGNSVASSGTTSNTRRYCGEELDPDTALVNLRARHYRPSAGRFITLDSLDYLDSRLVPSNRYLFAHANPVGLIDATGHMATVEKIGTDQRAARAHVHIYAFIETTYNRVYVGITNNLERRMSEHIRRLAKRGMKMLQGSFTPLFVVSGRSDKIARPVARAMEQGLIWRIGGITDPMVLNASNSMSMTTIFEYLEILQTVGIL